MELYNIGIEEYKEKYKITKDGEVWSCRANRFLKKCKIPVIIIYMLNYKNKNIIYID